MVDAKRSYLKCTNNFSEIHSMVVVPFYNVQIVITQNSLSTHKPFRNNVR